MESSFRLGRIAGIEIGVNWSWLVVFALITWSLAAGIFPDQDPGRSNGTYLAMAVVAALLFFVSLLAHELGHAVTARREGMELDGITLWLFGGVARFKGMFPSAAAELRIALAGPAVSLAIGVVCSVLAWLIALPFAVDGVLAWLGYVNLILLVFNLLPALPLDGGRVLRAVLWQTRRDFGWATNIAASIGRGLGYLLIVGGVFLFIFLGAFGGAWLAFIGWFLLGAAGSEQRHLAARQALDGLRVRDLMTPDPVTVPAAYTVGRFMDEVAWQRRHTTYPVVDDGHVVGLLAFRCISSIPRGSWDTRSIRECMIPLDRVPRLRPDTAAIDALVELSETNVNRGVVLEQDRLVGIISAADLGRALEVRPRRARRPAARGGEDAGQPVACRRDERLRESLLP
ncbi:MAG TPA: site-2 protease family protein, partial [Gaiellaceae bacterium]|nr:site-2 protease family protein [Gaiellaceae bacterium]